MGRVIYLCGPISGCGDEECRGWREHVKSIWGGLTLDPMRRDYRGREDANFRQIIEFDKIDIANSDIVLVNYNRPSAGTSMEILYAWEREKTVVLVTDPKDRISPWLRYHSHKIFYSFPQAISWIEGNF